MSRILGHELTLHKLEVLSLVEELESVSLAANRLSIAQPVVTAHLRSIEKKIGVKITYKSGRRIAFTDEGMRVVRWARDVLNRTNALQRELAEARLGNQGSAVVATSMTVGSYMLADRLVDFKQTYPGGEIAVLTTTPKHVANAVISGEVDIGLSFLDISHDVDGLDVQVAGFDDLVLAGTPENAGACVSVGPSHFKQAQFISAARGSSRRKIEDNLLTSLGLRRPNIFLELGHAEAMIRATKTGVGLAFLFRASIQEELTKGELTEIPLPGLDQRIPIYLLKARSKRFTPFQEALFAFLRTAISDSDRSGDTKVAT